MRRHIVSHIQRMQSIDADQQDMLDLVTAQFIVTRVRRNRCSEQGNTKHKCCDAFSQEHSPFKVT